MSRFFGKRGEQHQCRLPEKNESDTGLPQCHPGAGRCRRALRRLRQSILVSFRHPLTRYHFRSRPALVAERRRHNRSRSWFVIHPLSVFSLYRRIFMAAVRLLWGICAPYYTGLGNAHLEAWCMFEMACMLDIPVNFIQGYIDPKTQNVVIDFRSTAKRYLLSYFLPDVLSTMTLPTCITIANVWVDEDKYAVIAHCGPWAIGQCCFKIFRVLQAMEDVEDAINYLGFSKFVTTIWGIMIRTLMAVHFAACMIYTRTENMTYGMNIKKTFLEQSGLLFESDNAETYLIFLLHTCCLFFHSSAGLYPIETMDERLMWGSVMILGLFHLAHAIVRVYDVVNIYATVGNKFEDIERQLNEYMLQKRLPLHLRKRIASYYHHRFEKKYFRESFILDTMTEHLRYEILLFTCMPMVEKAQFFSGLPRHLIGQLMASFTREVFLHQEVVFMCGDVPSKVYFIYSGSVAVYSPEGVEMTHYVEGSNFGEGAFLMGGNRTSSTVSVEVTETYTLTYFALRRYLRPYPQFFSRMQRKLQERRRRDAAEMERLNRCRDNADPVEIADTLEYL